MAPSHSICRPTTSVPLTEAALCAWIGMAAAGDRLAYHRGFLALDLSPETQHLSGPARTELTRVASRARQLAERGLAHLVQRREGHGDYTYLLVARPRMRWPSGNVLQQVLDQAELLVADATAKVCRENACSYRRAA
jgi:hypothetical protein